MIAYLNFNRNIFPFNLQHKILIYSLFKVIPHSSIIAQPTGLGGAAAATILNVIVHATSNILKTCAYNVTIASGWLLYA